MRRWLQEWVTSPQQKYPWFSPGVSFSTLSSSPAYTQLQHHDASAGSCWVALVQQGYHCRLFFSLWGFLFFPLFLTDFGQISSLNWPVERQN